MSPAAPAHHFGDAAGLLAAVATNAFDELTSSLEAGNRRGGTDPVTRLREQGIGYVAFALRYPGRFGLMFRTGVVEKTEEMTRSGDAAFGRLEQAVRHLAGIPADQPLEAAQWRRLLSIWSVVHGFAHLALSGQLDRFAPAGRESLLRTTLAPLLDQFLAPFDPPATTAAPARSKPGRKVKQAKQAASR